MYGKLKVLPSDRVRPVRVDTVPGAATTGGRKGASNSAGMAPLPREMAAPSDPRFRLDEELDEEEEEEELDPVDAMLLY